MILDFLYGNISPWKNALRHSLLGLAVQFAMFCCTFSMLYGAIFVTGFYFGRERRDVEIYHNLPTREWYKYWNVFAWPSDEKWDFFPVTIVVWMVYIAQICIHYYIAN